MNARVLDPCCGSRMMWFDRQHPDAIFGDQRAETLTLTDRSHGNESGTRALAIDRGAVRYFNGEPCPSGHITARYTLSGFCVECQRLATRAQKTASKAKRQQMMGAVCHA